MHLRKITEKDLPNLRKWRNGHREAFFYKEEISSEQQGRWYSEYRNRPNDYMFIVLSDDAEVGCIGIRLVQDHWDIYNVIRISQHGKGVMGHALQLMILLASSLHSAPVMVKVLKENAAIKWYEKNGFKIISEYPDYFHMAYRVNE